MPNRNRLGDPIALSGPERIKRLEEAVDDLQAELAKQRAFNQRLCGAGAVVAFCISAAAAAAAWLK